MSDRNGWIKLHRELLDSKLWSCSDATLRVALYLILEANHDRRYVRRIEIERGQTVRSWTRIAADCNLSTKAVRYALALLEKDGFVTTDTPFGGAQQGHRITICKYEDYQCEEAHRGAPGAHEGNHEGNHEGTTNKNYKNEKNYKNPLSGEGADRPAKARTFKQWGETELRAEVDRANHDDLLTDDEAAEFVGHWMQRTATGRTKLSLQQTWDTRLRMHTAVRLVYGPQRERLARSLNTRQPREAERYFVDLPDPEEQEDGR